VHAHVCVYSCLERGVLQVPTSGSPKASFRAMKEKFGISELHKEANRINFGEVCVRVCVCVCVCALQQPGSFFFCATHDAHRPG
jgi:hypothetical protein